MVPVAPIITGITLASHISHALNFYYKIFVFRIFSAFFLITFQSPEIATSVNVRMPFLV
jgi:hypothetical protein